jgi:hypothetical protein
VNLRGSGSLRTWSHTSQLVRVRVGRAHARVKADGGAIVKRKRVGGGGRLHRRKVDDEPGSAVARAGGGGRRGPLEAAEDGGESDEGLAWRGEAHFFQRIKLILKICYST